jgi:hypothetical protein
MLACSRLVVKFFTTAIDARWLAEQWPCSDVCNQYINREFRILSPAGGLTLTVGSRAGGWTVSLMPTRFDLNCVMLQLR